MLYTTALMLITVWLLGIVDDYPMGGMIYIFPAIAVVLVLLNSRLKNTRI